MRLTAEYQPTALFTLKQGQATSTGAKTLLVPTPFAIRTALLDVAIRVEGVAHGPVAFETLRSARIALCPPHWAVVTNLFAKVLKPVHADKDRDEAMQRTIAFREYVHFKGELGLAFIGTEAVLRQIARWLPHLTYLGRRGSFMQLLNEPDIDADETLPKGFVHLTSDQFAHGTFPLGTLQMLDEWGPSLTYEKVNTFNPAGSIRRPGTGEDRLRYPMAFAYQFRRAGRGYTLYEYVG